MPDRPLWLLDVDGVLNAAADHPDPGVWPDYRQTRASAAGRMWRITYSPSVTATVRRWAEAGRVEIRWLTTWGAHANESLAEELGLPRFAVAGTPGASDVWWKLPFAREAWDAAMARDPQRRLIWTDDQLGDAPEALEWLEELGPRALGVAPDPISGLSPEDLARIEDFLAASPA